MKLKSVLCSAAVLLTVLAGSASADIVYTFNNTTFDDGTALNGTFTTNDAITSLLDYDITSVNGGITGFNYTPLTAGDSSTSLPGILVLEPASLDHILEVTFNGGLTASGAPITIGQFDSFEQDAAGTHRQILTGNVTVSTNSTSVPEPITLSLLGAGLAGAVGMRRRKKA